MALFNNNGSEANDSSVPSSSDTAGEEGVEFIPSMPSGKVGGINDIASRASEFVTAENGKKLLAVADALRSGDPTKAAGVFAGIENSAFINELIAGTIDSIKVGPSSDQMPPSGPVSGGGFNNSFANNNRLSADFAPTEIRLATGIDPNLYSPDFHTAEESYASPLHMSCVNFRIPTVVANNPTASYYTTAIVQDIFNRVQSNIGFTLPAVFTAANFTATMNVLCEALELYYSISRLIVYGNDPRNKNEALLYLRGQLDQSTIDQFFMLKRLLEGEPIPPNLNAFIYYLSQIYCSSENPGAPVIMTCPHDFTTAGVPSIATQISTARTNLVSPTTITILSVVGKAFKKWRATKLFAGVSNPKHDPNFNTIWINLPFDVAKIAGANPYTVKGPSISSVTAEIKYNSWENNLDGGAYGVMSIWKDTPTTGWIPGFLLPRPVTITTEYTTSRISWMNRGGVTRFYDSDNDDCTAFARDETYTTSSRFQTIANTSLPFGCERCFGASARSMGETATKLANWLFDIADMPEPYEKFDKVQGAYSLKQSNGKSSGKFKSKGPKSKGSKMKDMEGVNDEL